jgi:hypothetical protein
LHALDEIGAAYSGIEDPEMHGDPVSHSSQHVLHSAGFRFEPIAEFMQRRQSIRPVRNQQATGSHSLAGGVVLGEYVGDLAGR